MWLLTAISAVVYAPIALWLLTHGERATPLGVAGAMLIAAGVLVLTIRPGPVARGAFTPGLGYGLATGALIALYTLWDGWSVKHVLIPPLIFYWGGEVVRVLLFTPSALGQRAGIAALWREQRARVLGIALLSPLSYILILIAFQLGPVSHIAPALECPARNRSVSRARRMRPTRG